MVFPLFSLMKLTQIDMGMASACSIFLRSQVTKLRIISPKGGTPFLKRHAAKGPYERERVIHPAQG